MKEKKIHGFLEKKSSPNWTLIFVFHFPRMLLVTLAYEKFNLMTHSGPGKQPVMFTVKKKIRLVFLVPFPLILGHKVPYFHDVHKLGSSIAGNILQIDMEEFKSISH